MKLRFERKKFQFHLRTLFVIVTICGFCCRFEGTSPAVEISSATHKS